MHHNNSCIIDDLSLFYPLSSFIILLVLLQRWCHHLLCRKLVVLI